MSNKSLFQLKNTKPDTHVRVFLNVNYVTCYDTTSCRHCHVVEYPSKSEKPRPYDVICHDRYKSEVISKLQMRRELEMLQRELESVGSPVVFCHNDLLPANIVYDEKKGGLRLIKLKNIEYNNCRI